MDLAKNRLTDLFLPVGMIACLMIIFVPLPAGMMDVLLASNIAIAVVILLATVYVKTPLELSVFPAVLLVTTLARLALNIGTTRLILTRGPVDGELAAGGVINSFSHFVTGDSLAVGLVIFAIIFVIQFVVITKGATRISEVSARFALDGMPGRQMAIDADLNSGAIDNEQAKQLRSETIAHADFYGAMDGASKFVRGDAIAAVLITLINIVGGLAIGLSQSMSLGEAAETFTRLTIGDGLASQVPALLISLAAGLLVTRSTQKTNLPRESVTQVFARPIVLLITAAFLLLMILTELPKLPLALIAAGCLVAAYLLLQPNRADPPATTTPQPISEELTLQKLLRNDVVELELGLGLIRLADRKQGGNLLDLISQVRQRIASEMGLLLPKIRVRDNLQLQANDFRVLIHGSVVEKGHLEPQCCAAIDNGHAKGPLQDGTVTGMVEDHLTIFPAFWVGPDSIEAAAALGYQVKSSSEILADQLRLTAIEHAEKILTRDLTKQLIDELRTNAPAVVDGLIPNQLSIAEIQAILKSLVREGVSIRPLGLILETLGDHVDQVKSKLELVEKVRIRLGKHITAGLAGDLDLAIPVFKLAPEIENRIACAWEREFDEVRLNLPRQIVESIGLAIQDAAKKMETNGLQPIALVDQTIRPIIAQLAVGGAANMFVLGTSEAGDSPVEIVGEISGEQIVTIANAA